MARRSAAAGLRPVLAMHERVDRDSRRAFSWMVGDRPFWSARMPLAPADEVRQIIRAWTAGERRPIWLLADPTRTDLALIDPHARRRLGDFAWPFDVKALTGHTRPGRVVWYELASPGWFVGPGWALTPELAGADVKDGTGPSRAPIEAWVRRRQGPALLILGGRDGGRPGTEPGRVTVRIDGRPLAAFPTRTGLGFFLQFLPVPHGALVGDGHYAHVVVVAEAEDQSGRPTDVTIEQFDVQDADRVMFAYERGWHERGYDPTTGATWRWTSERAAVRVHAAGRDVVVRVTGEVPRGRFTRPPVVSIRAGGRELSRFDREGAFVLLAVVPRSILSASDSLVHVTTDLWFEQGRGEGGRRRYGIRVFDVSVTDFRP
jgi:hypothetical protein